MPEAADAIISIHRVYADAIFAGTKTVELRRRVPKMPFGTRLWIYAPRPTSAVIGFVVIHSLERADPETIWKNHCTGAGIDRATFQNYFYGASEAVAILLVFARRVGPITIQQLSQIRGRFHPPQVLMRLTASESNALRKLAGSDHNDHEH